MFGRTFDYFMLRPLTYRRNMATEKELDAAHAERKGLVIDDAMAELQKFRCRLEGYFPIGGRFHYLDGGCGTRGMVIFASWRMVE